MNNVIETLDQIMSSYDGRQSIHAVSHKSSWNQSHSKAGAVTMIIGGYRYSFSATACTAAGALKKAVAKRAATMATNIDSYDWLVDHGYVIDCVAA